MISAGRGTPDILLIMHGPVAVRVVSPKQSTEVAQEGLLVGAEIGGSGGRGGRGIDFSKVKTGGKWG